MSVYKFGSKAPVGASEIKVDAPEAIQEIPSNRTLIVQKLTEEAPFTPEAVYDLKTTKEVFDHFQPKSTVTFETEDGQERKEVLEFGTVDDFNAKSIKKQSKQLSALNVKTEQYNKIAKQLGSNKALMKALRDDETKAAMIELLKAALEDLEAAKPKDEE